MKLISTAILIVTLAAGVAAQAPCFMKLEELPDLHGIRLGIMRAEFEMVNISGEAGIRLPGTGARPDLSHLENIWLGFYKDRLTSVEFDYDRNTEWKTVREFAAALETRLKLPIASWIFIDTTEAKIACSGFSAAISSVRNTLSLTDTDAKAEAKRESLRASKLSASSPVH
ncbi:MAG TPA: hypothetical protein PKD26_11575 [Pyrinomonadaceae bacterium]|nr:hypothetical protein [Pyrinomonadaceae bacterium]